MSKRCPVVEAMTNRTWLQVLNEYTNQYPMFAVIVYLFNHEVESDGDDLCGVSPEFLVRYCLYTGSTTAAKFGIYPMTSR